jgi:hypothetical protein
MDETKAMAMTALSICESLLLSLADRGVIDEEERVGLLDDVLNAHLNAASSDADRELHEAVAKLVAEMQEGRNALQSLQKLWDYRGDNGTSH